MIRISFAEGILPVSTSEHSMRRQCSKKSLLISKMQFDQLKNSLSLSQFTRWRMSAIRFFISIFLPFPLDIFGCFQILSASFRNTHSIDASFCSSAQVWNCRDGWGSDGSGQRGSKLTIIAIIILLTLDNWKKKLFKNQAWRWVRRPIAGLGATVFAILVSKPSGFVSSWSGGRLRTGVGDDLWRKSEVFENPEFQGSRFAHRFFITRKALENGDLNPGWIDQILDCSPSTFLGATTSCSNSASDAWVH